AEARGHGIGQKLVEMCLEFAKNSHFDSVYLETFPNMKSAQGLYKKYGFEYISEPVGGTGHTSCDVWMLKTFK
ncbi:MAG: GNAT family N-acetyltransferase, partial [Bacteroidota bacterium]|nr:GNAT family N-acetyltransferase [Bacteroidota bacterium]